MQNKVRTKSFVGGRVTWLMLSLMYILTSDTVEPYGKLEFFWRTLAGPFNFIPGI